MAEVPSFSYLVNGRCKSARSHLWNGKDTLCRMASTGGLGRDYRKRWRVSCEPVEDQQICALCYDRKQAALPRDAGLREARS